MRQQGSRAKCGKGPSVAATRSNKPKKTGEIVGGCQSSRVLGERRTSTASAKQPRVPREISLAEDAQPVSPLHRPRPAVKSQPCSSGSDDAATTRNSNSCKGGELNNKSFNSSKSDLIQQSKSSGLQYGDSPSVRNESSDTSSCARKRTDPSPLRNPRPAVNTQRFDGSTAATSYPSVGDESDTNSCVLRRSDPPGVMKRSSSRNSIFLLLKDRPLGIMTMMLC